MIKEGQQYKIYNGDCVTISNQMLDENSIDFSVYSLPFADLFTYSSEKEDMGNCRDHSVNHSDIKNRGEFYYNYRACAVEMHRIMKPGCVVAVHLSQLLATQVNHGYIGLRDFHSTVRAAMCDVGFTFFGEFIIKKNQQAVGIRTHASTLVMATWKRDTSKLAPCFNDYVLIFKKKGERHLPVNPPRFTREEWINWASGVWLDIKESDTLQVRGTKETDQEKHVCPLQLEVIRRMIKMYWNEGETVFTPFMGIGSEIVTALGLNQFAIGVELKKTYFNETLKNIKKYEKSLTQESFDFG